MVLVEGILGLVHWPFALEIIKEISYMQKQRCLGKCQIWRLRPRQCYKDKIMVETNSLVLQKIILKEWRVPWNIKGQIEQIQEIAVNKSITFKHTYREANQLADTLANLALEENKDIQYSSFQQLSKECRGIINLD